MSKKPKIILRIMKGIRGKKRFENLVIKIINKDTERRKELNSKLNECKRYSDWESYYKLLFEGYRATRRYTSHITRLEKFKQFSDYIIDDMLRYEVRCAKNLYN